MAKVIGRRLLHWIAAFGFIGLFEYVIYLVLYGGKDTLPVTVIGMSCVVVSYLFVKAAQGGRDN